MKNKLLLFTVILVYSLYAQNEYVNQVLILNEGSYDYYEEQILEPVTVGKYDPVNNLYNTILEIDDARFASDLIIDGDFFYVAADNKILKYDLNTYELIAFEDVSGVRKIAIYEDNLFVTKGDYDLSTFSSVIFDSYLDVYSKIDLTYISSFDVEDGPQWSTENLLIYNDLLYVVINNAYDWGNYKGILGVVDLVNMTYLSEIELGEDAKNPINLMLKDNALYTINNKNWDGSSVSIIDLDSFVSETITLSNVSAGCGVSIIRDQKLNYQKMGDVEMYIFDLDNLAESGIENNLNENYYAVSENPLNSYLYTATANFTSNSNVTIYDNTNNQVNTFLADVATSKIVFDVRQELTSIKEVLNNSGNIIKVVDVFGREAGRKGLNLEIYDNGHVNKKYIIE